MSMPDSLSVLKMELTQKIVPEIVSFVAQSIANGEPVHAFEQGLWDLVLKAGHKTMETFFKVHGTGDLGPTISLPDGQEVNRLAELHSRRYVSIFGEFALSRTVYGSREGQALAYVPLDNRLQLPESVFSYLLQDWDQSLAVEQAFSQVNRTISRMLHLEQSVDSLEGMNRQMAEQVGWFRDLQGSPPAAEEGAIVVVSTDQRG